MKIPRLVPAIVAAIAVASTAHAIEPLNLSRAELADKIRGAWAGQMIGVTYGAKTEFKALGHTFDDPIEPAGMDNAIDQDDLYVEMTFAQVMDTVGLDATTEQYGEAFKNSRYHLWHANAAARRNLQRGLKAPLSGHPKYSLHSDDIDFQIEADFIGIMCPGLPQSANVFAERVGRVMNHGDGLYGGMFVSGMYAAAFFEKDPRRIVEAGLASIPAGSSYAAVIRDVLAWTADYPDDWRRAWQLLEDTWDRDDICPDGALQPFNIDAKLNGAYIALGLIYGAGDWGRTLEISTRSGQDSDCNPSSAAGILGVMFGFNRIPEQYRTAITGFADTNFSHTNYSFNDIVASTERRALAVIQRAGGSVTASTVSIPIQAPQPPVLEHSGYGKPVRVIGQRDPAWKWKGDWQEKPGPEWTKRLDRVSTSEANEAILTFTGTGLGLVGDLSSDGGRAEVYVDGKKSDVPADAFVAGDTHDNDLWRVQGLVPGEHTVRLVTLADADPRSTGHTVKISSAIVFEDDLGAGSATASLDEIERNAYKAGPSPLDSKATLVATNSGAVEIPAAATTCSLDGSWQLVEGTAADWDQSVAAVVPGSVHTALYAAGVIPFPYLGRNQEIAAKWSGKTYWYRKTFPRPPAGQDQTLVFEGICNRCTIWLNDRELGQHEGMFTRIEYPVRDLLQETNSLVVKLDPAIDWKQTVVFNNSYGWHYSKFPPLGIWRSVEIRGDPPTKVGAPFIATRDITTGLMDLVTTITRSETGGAGKLVGVITPENFDGEADHFEYPVDSVAGSREVHLQFKVSNPQLWWPVDMGKPNLYRLKLAFLPADGGESYVQQTTFGIRTVQMEPIGGKPRPHLYNWKFVINGKPMFVKGTGWCTNDAMMDFSRSRYDRFLTLAVSEHIQMLRAWGSGMVETDDFYDLCDRKGILVMQEWPTAGDSHATQPYKLMEEAVRENTLRLRSHPSLAMYTGGNESGQPLGAAIDMMGRLNLELDGTRAFHRGEPRGGSEHDYDVYWGGRSLDLMFQIQAPFYGEFGIASYPGYESVQRFLPDDEKSVWPAPPEKSFAYHTPVFNNAEDLNRLTRMSQYFTAGRTMERFIVGTQLAQAVGVRHTLERARTRWPECSGALFYKLNDNCPAASWATVDWYGAPKISHYLIQNSFAPLVAVALFPKATTRGEPLALPVFLLDDANTLDGNPWEVVVRAFGADLRPIKELRFPGTGSIGNVARLGEFPLTAEQTRTAPLFVVTDVVRRGVPVQRNYYFTNFEPVKDCLFELPRTRLRLWVGEGQVVVKNDGALPAVGVDVSRPGHLDTFAAGENYFWLEPGEEKSVMVNTTEGAVVSALNGDQVAD